MISKLKVWCVLGLMTACAPSDDTSPDGRQDNVEYGDEEIEEYDAGYRRGTAQDAGHAIRPDSGFPKPATSCDPQEKQPAPRCEEPLYVAKCMTQERIETLVLELCGDEFVGGTTIEAGARECEFGTDAAWVICCYGDAKPTAHDAGDKPPTKKDAGSLEVKDASAFGENPEPRCVDVGVGSEECAEQEELAIKLAAMCKEQGLTLYPFKMDVVKDCSQGYGYHMSGQCCSSWQ